MNNTNPTTRILRTVAAAIAALPALTLPAHAEAASAATGTEALGQLLPLILIMVIFWFLLIRPQQKRVKEHKAMVAELKKGDKVITGGGIIGTVTDVKENILKVEIAEGIRVQVQRETIVAKTE